MSFIKKGVALLLFVFHLLVLYSQEYNFQTYSLEQGMPQSQVLCIEQDNEGYVWFGTNSGGAARSDGKEFEVFTKEEHGLANNLVYSITKISSNELWFGTLKGISIFNGNQFIEIPQALKELDNSTIKAICRDNLGRIWIGTTTGIFEYADNELFEHTAYRGAIINSIFQDSKNNLWFCTQNFGMIRSKGGVYKMFLEKDGLPLVSINSIAEKSKEAIYVGTNAGVYVFDEKTENFLPFNWDEENKNMQINTMYADDIGHLWIGTYRRGMYELSPTDKQHYTVQNGLSNMAISVIYQDREKNLWFGTDGGGAIKYANKMFVNYNKNSGLPEEIILSVMEDKKGNMWFGTYDGVVVKKKGETLKFNKTNGFVDKKVWSVIQCKNGDVMLATYGSGVYTYSNGNFSVINKEKGLTSDNVRALFQDSKNTIWIGTSAGINRILPNGTLETFITPDGLKANRILAFYEDRNQNMWIATSGGGVVKYDGNSFAIVDSKMGLADETVLSIAEDYQGNIWCAHYAGVSCINPKTLQLENISKKDGLTSNTIYIVAYDRKNILIGSNAGLDILNVQKFNENKEIEIYHFDNKDGYKGIECNTNAKFRDKEGNIWLGTIRGAVKYLPAMHFSNDIPPVITIKDVRLRLKPINWKEMGEEVVPSSGYPANPTFPYDDNYLTFDYVGISHKSPEKISYKVKLEGFDDDWSPPISERFISYNNLPSGKYTFQVKAMNGVGSESVKPATFEFTILAPFWRSWWFILLVISAIALFVYLLVIAWYRRIELKQQLLETQVNNKTRELELQKVKVETVNKEIAKKNKDITSSIAYAKQIQNAVLLKHDTFNKILPHSFIYFKPKDIVSGDFYWIAEEGDEVLLAVVDCTGHGVPGAFMSLIGNELLNKAVKEKKLTDPSVILNELHNGIIEVFNIETENTSSLVGMDLSLCSFNKKNHILKYAATGRPMVYFHEGKQHLVKAGKHPLGMRIRKERTYRSQTIQLTKGDVLYLFTDGYCDQFGEITGEKFMYNRFSSMLEGIHELDMNIQLSSITQTMNEWQGKETQLDDMCVIGVRV